MEIDQITVTEANAIIDGKHYLGAVGYLPRYCLATAARDAVAVFGYPNAASFKVALQDPLELVRLWRADGATVRTDHFLHRCLMMVRKLAPDCDAVFSYADPKQGHTGAVYKGVGFKFAGKSRITDEWETATGKRIGAAQAYRALGTKSRKRIAELRPDWRLVEGVPKLLFVFPMAMTISDVLSRLGQKLPAARRALFSRARGGFRVSVYQEKFPPKSCEHCGRLFLPKRSDARFHSDSCRVMAARKRLA